MTVIYASSDWSRVVTVGLHIEKFETRDDLDNAARELLHTDYAPRYSGTLRALDALAALGDPTNADDEG